MLNVECLKLLKAIKVVEKVLNYLRIGELPAGRWRITCRKTANYLQEDGDRETTFILREITHLSILNLSCGHARGHGKQVKYMQSGAVQVIHAWKQCAWYMRRGR